MKSRLLAAFFPAIAALSLSSCIFGDSGDSGSSGGGDGGGGGGTTNTSPGGGNTQEDSCSSARAEDAGYRQEDGALREILNDPSERRAASRGLASATAGDENGGENSDDRLSAEEATIQSPPVSGPTFAGCSTLTGTSWTPSVTGAASGNHKDTITIYKSTYTASGKLTGLDQPIADGDGHTVTISGIDMSQDLGTGGSVSLVAELTSFPGNLYGAAWPVLVSLSDGVNELVGMYGCDSGFYKCCNGLCTRDTACTPSSTSAFLGATATERRTKWEQHQKIGTSDYLSINSFPTCNWSSGSPTCTFNSTHFDAGKLRTGTYTAKFVLLTSSYSKVGDSYSANMKLTVVRKKDQNDGADADGAKGAIDLNVVLVGNTVIQDSRSDKGKQNLDELLNHVYRIYFTENASTTGIKLGSINVYEWDCASGGDVYANVDIDDTGYLFEDGSALMPGATESKAVNLFLTSTIPYGGGGTILGLAGGITGAMINSTTSSGVVVATFNKLDTFNPDCSGTQGAACPVSDQEPDFIDMGNTIAHEVGHFIGLNHLSESSGSTHDRVPDTPNCSTKNAGSSSISISSCLKEEPCKSDCGDYNNNPYCPLVTSCQFNHVMWWTGKNYSSTTGAGDGSLFSADSGGIMNYSPYVQ